jgi:putative radical SAM enzyme (TIGR03279 family)
MPVRDLIDYCFLEADEIVTLDFKKADGEEWVLELEKDYDQDLGLEFEGAGFGPTIRCTNHCIFCFVDQMPPGMRKTLYVKDDDYRLSFWSGNFITLTNLTEKEMQRIVSMRLSPLYISVHTTNPELRRRMLGNKKAGLIMKQLQELAAAGIEMHTQVVACPGINDGRELARTVEDLSGLWPEVRSLAVVPVGLTRFRQNCYPLRGYTRAGARELLRWLQARQEEFLTTLGNPFVFASDEFYLLSGEEIPPVERYAGFPQLENGVGLTRLFLEKWEKARARLFRKRVEKKITLVTGVLGEQLLNPVVAALNQVEGLQASLKVIRNRFFGESTTVAGLITGTDLLSQVRPPETGDLLVLPAVSLKKDEPVFLDGISLPELGRRLKVPVAAVAGPDQLVDVLLEGLPKATWFTSAGS